MRRGETELLRNLRAAKGRLDAAKEVNLNRRAIGRRLAEENEQRYVLECVYQFWRTLGDGR